MRRERLDSFLQEAGPQAREQFEHIVREVSGETKEEPELSRINALRRHLGSCPDWLKPAIEDLIDEETTAPTPCAPPLMQAALPWSRIPHFLI